MECPTCGCKKSSAVGEARVSDYYVELGGVKFKAIESQQRKCSKKKCNQCFVQKKLIEVDLADALVESTEE